MHWTRLKGNALEVTSDISSSLNLSSMLCCQALLKCWPKLVDVEGNLNPSVPNYCFYAVNLTCKKNYDQACLSLNSSSV